jgi:hypothetical protein
VNHCSNLYLHSRRKSCIGRTSFLDYGNCS